MVEHPAVTDTERRSAALVHLAGIVAPLWLPGVIWAVSRKKSRYVAAHAWQEFWDGIIWKGILLLVMLASVTWTVVRLVYHINTKFAEWNWDEMLWKVIVSVVVFVTLWLWNLVQALVQSSRAWKGQWPKRELKKLAKGGGAPSF